MKRASATLIGLALVLGAAPASASEADDLFKQGIKLLEEGKVQDACSSFERSQSLEPAAGTLLNLAGCYERLGKKALALRTFRKAQASAHARGRADWETMASDHLRTLGASVPFVTFRVREPSPVEIFVDGEPLPKDERGVPFPVDPGAHDFEARAASRKPFTTHVEIRRSVELEIPTLESAALVDTRKPAPSTDDDPGKRTKQIVGLAVGGAGVVVIGFGAVAGFVASSALGDARASCPSYPDRCTSDASAPNDRASTWSTISTVSFIAGVGLAAAGVAIFFWPTPKSSVAVGVAPGQTTLRATF